MRSSIKVTEYLEMEITLRIISLSTYIHLIFYFISRNAIGSIKDKIGKRFLIITFH